MTRREASATPVVVKQVQSLTASARAAAMTLAFSACDISEISIGVPVTPCSYLLNLSSCSYAMPMTIKSCISETPIPARLVQATFRIP